MLQFKYTARQRGGNEVTGTIAAPSLPEATKLLRDKALFPVRVERSSMDVQGFKWRGRKVPSGLLAKFYSQFSDLLRSGVPLLRSLEILKRQSLNARLQAVLNDIWKRVSEGEGVSDAMAAHEDVFGELAVSMVKAGQEGGFLEDVFKRISIFTERQEELRGKVVGAMAYPAVLCGIGTVIISVLLIYFVPKFEKIFDKLREKGDMPQATEWLLATSAFMQEYWLYLFGGIIVGWFLLMRQAATPAGRRFADTYKLKLPIFGPVFRDLAITRFNRVLGTLRRNGVPILAALRIAKDSTGNILMKDAIDRAADNVQQGDKLATPLRASKVFPDEIVEMIEVAEESNNLENVLLESADNLEATTTRSLEMAVRFLEPLLLLLMAAATMMVVVALLLPIFKMTSALG